MLEIFERREAELSEASNERNAEIVNASNQIERCCRTFEKAYLEARKILYASMPLMQQDDPACVRDFLEHCKERYAELIKNICDDFIDAPEPSSDAEAEAREIVTNRENPDELICRQIEAECGYALKLLNKFYRKEE